MSEVANPELIKLARQSRGYSQKQLADLAGIAQPHYSRIEAGNRESSDSILRSLSEVLDYPERFFMRSSKIESPGTDSIFHRKRKSVPKWKLDQVYALSSIRRLEIQKLIDNNVECALPSYPMELYDDPAKIARTVRAARGIPPGPIFNMTKLVEQIGGVVIPHKFGTKLIDGFSNPPRMMLSIFDLNSDLPSDRWRWTLAHELGHIVMDHDPGGSPQEIEKEANQFAGEFLAPGHEIAPMLHDLSIPKLAGLKLEWKISMQALVERAFHLGVITANRRRDLHVQLSKAGYKTQEPEQLAPPIEPPSRLFDLVNFHMTVLEYTRTELMDLLSVNNKDFRTYYYDPQDIATQIEDAMYDEWRLN